LATIGIVFPLILLPILCALKYLYEILGYLFSKSFRRKSNTVSAHFSFDGLELGFGSSSLGLSALSDENPLGIPEGS
jgi:hypothetical protein